MISDMGISTGTYTYIATSSLVIIIFYYHQVKEDNPLLFRKFTAIVKKLSFAEIIRPCKICSHLPTSTQWCCCDLLFIIVYL